MKKWKPATRVLLAMIGTIIALVLTLEGPTLALSLSGAITNPSTYSIAQLQTFTPITETLGGDTYVGASLWTFLGGMSNGNSNIITSGGGNNPILRNYVTATGSDGSKSLISVGEIDPLFGGTGQPYLLAYQKNGSLLSFPILIVPQDTTGARNILQLTDLTVSGAPRPPVGPGGTTTQFSLSGVKTPGTYDLAKLQSLPTTVDHNVIFFNGAAPNAPNDFTGVKIWTLLTNAGLTSQILTNYVLITGSDGYQVLFALGELDPDFGAPDDLIAYFESPTSIAPSDSARAVLPTDNRGGRYVSNIASLQIASAIPEPGAWVLFASGLTILVFKRTRWFS